MLQEHDVTVGSVTLHYAEGPANGVPLVVLHGGSARWQSWEPLLPALTAYTHLFAPDLRGHGRSSWHRPYSLQAYTDDIVAFLNQYVPKPAIVCGHSLGGMVALLAAARMGPTVRGVIIGDAPLDATTWIQTLEASRLRLDEWHTLATTYRTPAPIVRALKQSPVEVPGHTAPLPAQIVFGEDSPWFTWMADNLVHLDPATLEVLLHDAEQAAKGYHMQTVIPQIRCPVWLLQADPAAGGLLSDEAIMQAQQISAGVRCCRLEGVGHALHATHPDLVADAILKSVHDIIRRTS